MSLSTLAARGAVVTIGVQGARFVVQFAGLIVLGRILAPSDFGLVAMVTAVIGVGDIIREFGLVPATVQATSISRPQRSNLFWLNTGLGLLVAAAVFFASPLFSLIYDDKRVSEIALVLSLTFIFGGLQTQFQAGLAREMRFTALSITDLAAQVVGLGSAVIAAVLGLGYWALVIQLGLQSFSLLVFRVSAAQWLPGLPTKKASIRKLVVYGRSLVMTQVLVYASSNIDSLIIGARFGPAQLGYYNRGFQLLMMPLNQILTPLTAVALPVLSRINEETIRFNGYIRRAQILVAYPTVLLFATVSAAIEPLIRLVFGEQWLPSAAIFQVLSLAGAFQAIGYVSYWVFLSKGLTASHFRFSLISRSILIICIVVGSAWGPIGIAAGYSFGAVASWPLALLWLRGVAQIEVAPLFLGGLRAAILGMLCFCSGSVLQHFGRDLEDPLAIAVVVAGALAGAALLLILPTFRRDFVAILATIKLVVSRKRTEATLKEGAF
ncbi:polysaccharide transporter, PST family [Pseudarthrobacter equi]|uniref:Polysaccharide transporter, PST family n=1 Tax=Pseudarthrobacter equi TaxID=728066 RepID=A0A1H2B3I7_9MICC|nr:lipopolysaccharide biosynthesis protein [Pseudarthrobacter equi]SDT52820.1 polysaccharide transporter, PST family [Pseudarthrobacter equi]